MSSLAAHRPPLSLIERVQRAFNMEAVALLAIFYRDAFGGALRYYLDVVKLGPLWFIPDLLALCCVFVFLRRYVFGAEKNNLATAVFAYFLFSVVIAFLFFNSVPAVVSAIKMFLPGFVGFCFCGRYLKDYTKLLSAMTMLFYLGMGGIFLSSIITPPWLGYGFESFGVEREASRLWWTVGSIRLAGFAGDSTMAGFIVVSTFVLLSSRRSTLWCAVWVGIAMVAINMTTNKTSIGVLACYLAALVLVRFVGQQRGLETLRTLTRASFVLMLAPFLLIALFGGMDLASIDPNLFSLQDRINNSWQVPFSDMIDIMPTGLITGCGVGCFNYPMKLFTPDLGHQPSVDNFYLVTYFMFGLPFIVFTAFVIKSISRTDDIYKLTIVFFLNIFTVTVSLYGPACGLLLMSLAVSQVFSDPRLAQKAKAVAAYPGFVRRPARFSGGALSGPRPSAAS